MPMKWMLIPILAAAAFAQQEKVSLKLGVDVAPDRTVTITVPLDPGFQPFVLWGSISSSDPKENQTFQSTSLSGPTWRRVTSLPPGHYTVMVGLRNLDGHGRIGFAKIDVP